jgi:hypothetical protein
VQDELSAVRVLFELLGFLLRRLPTEPYSPRRHRDTQKSISSCLRCGLFAGIPAVLAVASKVDSLLQNLPPHLTLPRTSV